MRRVMTVFLPILLAIWLAAGVASLLPVDGAASTVAFWLALAFAWFAMVPVAGFIGGLVGFEPRRMNNLSGRRMAGRDARGAASWPLAPHLNRVGRNPVDA